MKQILRSLFRQFLFWILFFNVSRIVFLVYYAGLLRSDGAGMADVAGVFIASLRLDVAVACYFLILPVLFLSVQSFGIASWLNKVNKGYTGLMVFAYALTVTGELGIYGEWQSKLSYKALRYLIHPSEVYNSTDTATFFLLLCILATLTIAGIVSYVKWFQCDVGLVKRNPWAIAGFLFFTPAVLLLGTRGGIQEVPINQSESYFSRHAALNDVAVNNAFNLYVSIFENFRVMNRNPYVFMEQSKALEVVKNIYRSEKDTVVQVLNNTRPNIVLIILESFSADLIESLGGKPGITPEWRKLEQDGLLFTQVYTAGMRSEQGMAALFAGFPSHPLSSSVIQPEKYHALPRLPAILKRNGYHTSFYFGGQLIYGNIKGYIYYNGFDKIVEGEAFPDSFPSGKLGIHDGYVLDYLANEIGNSRSPFFTTVFTISSHSPYDQPYPKPLTWGGKENEYINSAYYTDHCLGEFFRKMKKLPSYSNTLFVLIADHSHSSYYNWYPGQGQYRRIPFMMTGGALKESFRGKVIPKLGNQHDLPATLLSQLGLPADAFHWSKNLLNPYAPDFAYFSNDNGYGWIRPGMAWSLDIGKDWIYMDVVPPAMKDSIRTEGEAYLQVLFKEYLDQ